MKRITKGDRIYMEDFGVLYRMAVKEEKWLKKEIGEYGDGLLFKLHRFLRTESAVQCQYRSMGMLYSRVGGYQRSAL